MLRFSRGSRPLLGSDRMDGHDYTAETVQVTISLGVIAAITVEATPSPLPFPPPLPLPHVVERAQCGRNRCREQPITKYNFSLFI